MFNEACEALLKKMLEIRRNYMMDQGSFKMFG
jgi:hypothetical protein